MRLRFLLGRAGTGKTHTCLHAIRSELLREPMGAAPLILLTPEQATFQMERALLAHEDVRATGRAQVLSFQRLGARVMQQTGGGAKPRLGELGKRMLLRALIQRHGSQLKLFRRAARQPGFVDRLAGTLTELRQYKVSPDDLARRLGAVEDEGSVLEAKMFDLHLIYRAFVEDVDEQFTDPDELLNFIAEMLPETDVLRGARIWVDGFAGFTPQELAVIRALWTVAARMDVALCLDPRHVLEPSHPVGRDLFAPTIETYERLTEMAHEDRVIIERALVFGDDPAPRFAGNEPLVHLERQLFRRPGRPFAGARPASQAETNPASDSGVGSGTGAESDGLPDPTLVAEPLRIVAAAGPRVEVEAAAKTILRLSRERGWRFRDMAVIVHELEPYEDLITAIFRDLNIPYFIDSRRKLTHHPLTELVRSMLEAHAGGWRTEAVIRCLKTDFFPVTRDEIDRLENYALAHGIEGSGWTRTDAWRYVRHFTLEPEAPRPTQDQERQLREINAIRDEAMGPLRPMAGRLGGVGREATARELASALWDVLEQLNVAVTLERWMEAAEVAGRIDEVQEHERAWQGVLQLLDELVNALGDTPMSVADFRQIVEAGLESLRVGMVPAGLDQVMVGTVERSRQPDIKAAFVLGASDRHFPPPPREDVIFTDTERERLSGLQLQLSPTSRDESLRQQYLLYISLTRASEYLWISYPATDGQGKEQAASATVRRLTELFPGTEVVVEAVEPDDDGTLLGRIATADELVALTALRLRRHRAGQTATNIWWELYHWFTEEPLLRRRAQPLFAALDHDNDLAPLPRDVARDLFGTPLHSSVSRLETFAACSFRHFAQNGLRLRERERWQLDAATAGTFVHAALRGFVARLEEDGLDWGALDDEQARTVADECVDELAPRLAGEILLSSARHAFLGELLRTTVRRAVWALTEHARRGRFRPVAVEASFGRGAATWPALTIELEDDVELHLSGQIDRVDVAKDDDGRGWVRVIDYKSSDHSLNVGRIVHGLSLQLPLYMAVVQEAAARGEWKHGPVQPAGLLYFPARDPILREDKPVDDAQWETLVRRALRMKGLLTDDVTVLRLMDDAIGSMSDLIVVRVTQKGTVYKGGNTASADQFEQLSQFVRASAANFGRDILAGHIDVAPYRIGNERACTHCPFLSVCQFDPLIEGNSFRRLETLSQQVAWESIEGAVS